MTGAPGAGCAHRRARRGLRWARTISPTSRPTPCRPTPNRPAATPPTPARRTPSTSRNDPPRRGRGDRTGRAGPSGQRRAGGVRCGRRTPPGARGSARARRPTRPRRAGPRDAGIRPRRRGPARPGGPAGSSARPAPTPSSARPAARRSAPPHARRPCRYRLSVCIPTGGVHSPASDLADSELYGPDGAAAGRAEPTHLGAVRRLTNFQNVACGSWHADWPRRRLPVISAAAALWTRAARPPRRHPHVAPTRTLAGPSEGCRTATWADGSDG